MPCSGIHAHLKNTANSQHKAETGVQIAALDNLKQVDPNGRFWLKLDACDLNDGLFEAVSTEWNGDCDLGDGTLQKLRAEYDLRREAPNTIMKIKKEISSDSLKSCLTNVIDVLQNDDKNFLSDGLKNARAAYKEKFEIGK